MFYILSESISSLLRHFIMTKNCNVVTVLKSCSHRAGFEFK